MSTEPVQRIFDSRVQSLEEALGIAGGAFSTCWEDLSSAGIFQSTQAKEIVDQLIEWINENTGVLNPENSKGESIVYHCLKDGEPFFVLRARDIFSIMVIREYLRLIENYGPENIEFQQTLVDIINVFRGWQTNRPTMVRYPD